MNDERNSIIGKIDWVTVLIYLALVLIGWFSIFSAKYDELHPSIFDMSQVYGKQLIWIGIALFLGFLVLLLDAKAFSGFAIIIYAAVMFALVALAIRKIVVDRRNGRNRCGNGCGSCPMSGTCGRKKKG